MRRTGAWTVLAVLLVGGAMAWAQGASTGPAAPADDAAVIRSDDSGRTVTATPSTSEAPAAGKGTETRPPGSLMDQWPMFIMLGGIVLLFFWMSRGKKKEAKRRQEMLSSLKKGDKITTIGGVIGTVLDVKDDEVTIKVDESANVKMKFARWAVRGVGEESKAENPQQTQEKK